MALDLYPEKISEQFDHNFRRYESISEIAKNAKDQNLKSFGIGNY